MKGMKRGLGPLCVGIHMGGFRDIASIINFLNSQTCATDGTVTTGCQTTIKKLMSVKLIFNINFGCQSINDPKKIAQKRICKIKAPIYFKVNKRVKKPHT